jgi:RNA polymerase sigma-70 factor (ECF subfamily)
MVWEDAELDNLLCGAADGDKSAFRELYLRTAPRQLAIARRILARDDLAEEAVQDAYVSIWQSAARFEPDAGSALGWITAIVRRRAIDRLRASPWLRQEVAELETAGEAQGWSADRMALEECLASLGPSVRRAIRLAYLYGLSHTQLSQKLDVPLGTLKSQLRRGLATLRDCLSR